MYYMSERLIVQFVVMMRTCPGIIHDISKLKHLLGYDFSMPCEHPPLPHPNIFFSVAYGIVRLAFVIRIVYSQMWETWFAAHPLSRGVPTWPIRQQIVNGL